MKYSQIKIANAYKNYKNKKLYKKGIYSVTIYF